MEKIYYKNKPNPNTRDTLREISDSDYRWLRTMMTAYADLQTCADVNPEYKSWFNMPNPRLPVQPLKRMERNSPSTWSEGIVKKIDQGRGRRDLSPTHCDGIEQLTELMAGIYNVPAVKFVEKTQEDHRPKTFNKIFGG